MTALFNCRHPLRTLLLALGLSASLGLTGCQVETGSQPLPMRAVPARHPELKRDADIVIVCHHGARSYQVAMFLEQQGFGCIHNLYGGLAAWARDVDPTMPTY